jgi:hypothetical protein
MPLKLNFLVEPVSKPHKNVVLPHLPFIFIHQNSISLILFSHDQLWPSYINLRHSFLLRWFFSKLQFKPNSPVGKTYQPTLQENVLNLYNVLRQG